VDEIGAALPAGSEGVVRLRTTQSRLNNREPASHGTSGNDSWFYPGDIGILGDDGLLRITSRSNDVINSGGVKVSASTIEDALRSIPAIADAAVVGVMGTDGIEKIWVAVVLREPIDNDEIKRRMVSHKNVGIEADEVFTVDTIPRGDLGKIQQYRLKEELLAMKKKDS
jgi:acyl-coenzyme A synthetase/AMP-(fatty) acid ligase